MNTADAMPAPVSVFELRRHLAADHADSRRGGSWVELELLHTAWHTHASTHTHEEPRP